MTDVENVLANLNSMLDDLNAGFGTNTITSAIELIEELSNKKTCAKLYGAREVATGKLVSNITNPRRKYWDKRGNAVNAITYHNNKDARWRRNNEPGQVELVTFELVEIPSEDLV